MTRRYVAAALIMLLFISRTSLAAEPVLIAIGSINGLYEELFVAGYVITLLKERRGLWFAVNVSVAIRLMYHLYQGALSVVVIVPMGLILGYWYARKGRLWPLVVAHTLIDLVGMLSKVVLS